MLSCDSGGGVGGGGGDGAVRWLASFLFCSFVLLSVDESSTSLQAGKF